MLIIALGNTIMSKSRQRHNAGVIVINNIAKHYNVKWINKRWFYYFELTNDEKTYYFAYPKTFMNLSGSGVKHILSYFSNPTFAIIHDDLDTVLGKIRIKHGGSHRGHNGVRSCINSLGKEFDRILIGIGRPESRNAIIISSYVLGSFTQDEMKSIDSIDLDKILSLF